MDTKSTISNSVEKALEIRSSVVTLARLAKVPAGVFAKGIADTDANADYLVELAGEMTKVEVARTRAEEIKNKAK